MTVLATTTRVAADARFFDKILPPGLRDVSYKPAIFMQQFIYVKKRPTSR
jgi:hypothetical protein